MAYSNFYATGTVTVSANGTAVTGTGTEWVTAGIVPGAAIFVAGHSRPLLVRSVTSETAIVLDMPAPQAASGAAYVMLTLAYDAPMVELLRRLLNQQTKAFDLDGEDKSLTLTTDAGTVETVYATETSGEGRFRFGLIGGDLDTFRIQRWVSGAWDDVLTISRSTGVTTWDGSPQVEATYIEGLVAEAEALRASLLQSISEVAGTPPANPWLIDGLPPSVLLLAGSGAMMLAGGYVDVTDILTFSSAAKRVIGPLGTLDTVAANTPAYDYSSGRRRLLIEARAATNLFASSGNLTTDSLATSNGMLVYGVSDPTGGSSASTLTSTGVGCQAITNVPASVGTTYAGAIYIRRRSGSGPIRVLDSAMAWSDVTVTSTWQRFSVSAIAGAGGAYAYAGVQVPTTGDSVDIFGLQVEEGAVATSYIPTTSAPATRIADDVRLTAAARAQVTGAGGFTLAVRGFIAGSGLRYVLQIYGGASSFFGVIDNAVMQSTNNATGGVNAVAGSGFVGLDTGLVAAGTSGMAPMRGAINGGSAESSPDAWNAITGVRIGSSVYPPPYMLIDELVIWPFVGSDVGIQSQARVYA